MKLTRRLHVDVNSKSPQRSAHPVITLNGPTISGANFFTTEQALGALPLHPHRHAPCVIRMWAVLQFHQLLAIHHTRPLLAYAALAHERRRIGLIDGLAVEEVQDSARPCRRPPLEVLPAVKGAFPDLKWRLVIIFVMVARISHWRILLPTCLTWCEFYIIYI